MVVRNPRLRAVCMVDVVVAGEAHDEKVGRGVAAQLLPGDRGAREGERQVVAERSRQQRAVEERAGLVLSLAYRLGQLSTLGVPLLPVGKRSRIGAVLAERLPFVRDIPSLRPLHFDLVAPFLIAP